MNFTSEETMSIVKPLTVKFAGQIAKSRHDILTTVPLKRNVALTHTSQFAGNTVVAN